MRTVRILAKENVQEILNNPIDFVDETFDKALVEIYDDNYKWMILLGKNEDDGRYYLVVEDDEMSEDYYPEANESLEDLYDKLLERNDEEN